MSDKPIFSFKIAIPEKIISVRIEKIKKMIEKYNPEFVIFYAWQYRSPIEDNLKIWNINFQRHEAEKKEFYWATFNNTIIIMCYHAAASVVNKYYEEIGKFAAS